MTVLVTGAAGFIGYHLTKRLLSEGFEVIGLDNFNAYYDPRLKRRRWADLAGAAPLIEGDLENPEVWVNIRREYPQIRYIYHLAAQAGVRYSLENPRAYLQSNLVGFGEVLEYARAIQAEHLVYASSSSVYGNNPQTPYRVEDRVDHPISLYAATKKANELMAHTYTHLYGVPTSGVRFFTVYGPWGRPDMAVWLFTKALMENAPLKVFHEGKLWRDFTFVDDIVTGLRAIGSRNSLKDRPFEVYNLGNHRPEQVLTLIRQLEELTGRSARIDWQPLQPGDVFRTEADTTALKREFGWEPSTPLREGLASFVAWYQAYHAEKDGK